ncbi:MAG: L,D-transpeptidase/peptidoglycan binding protein [Lachnospiraceae bacterium]|nr:L,D-transpeptidase/peptidoglycan binding protein [Lachnospiraceae bacterium]
MRKHLFQKKIFWFILIFFIMLLTVYISVAVYFGEHFYDNTVIYGIPCGQITAEEAKERVSQRLGEYVLQIEERGGKTETITAEDIGLTFVDGDSIDEMLREQRSYIWPLMFSKDHDALTSVAFSYDLESVEAALQALDCMDESLVTAPEDAYIEVTDTEFIVVDEVEGDTLDYEKTLDAVMAALDAGVQSLSLEEEGCYITPEVYGDDEQLNSDAEELSALAAAYIVYDFGDREEIVSAPVIADWITTMTDGTFVIDECAVEEYVEWLAEEYDTYEKPHEFITTGGETVTLEDGDYGWEMDQAVTLVDLLNALAEGYQGTLEPEYTHTAMSRDTDDIGGTYVEICISEQEMWCYQDGVCIVDTPVVTGNPNKGNATPSNGVWAIDGKRRNATLKGEGYSTPVNYWMPFNGNVGIHDLTSRSSFGGTIYLTNGSHGCINTPYTAAETIFNTVSVGTPVIVYD